MNKYLYNGSATKSKRSCLRMQPMLGKQQYDAPGNNPLIPPYPKGDIEGENPYPKGDINGENPYLEGGY